MAEIFPLVRTCAAGQNTSPKKTRSHFLKGDRHPATSRHKKSASKARARIEVEIFKKRWFAGASSHENVYDFRMRYSTKHLYTNSKASEKKCVAKCGEGWSDASGGIFAAVDAHLAQGGGMKFEAGEGTAESY